MDPTPTPTQSSPPVSLPIPPKLKETPLHLSDTQKIISDLESHLHSRVICYYLNEKISIRQSHADIFMEQLRHIGPQESIALVVVSNGGEGSATLRIATILREYCKNLTVIVPTRCASAATILALAADKIIMTPSGYLTAIDSSLVHPLAPKDRDNRPVSVSVDQIQRAVKFLDNEGPHSTDSQTEGSYRTLFKYVHPILVGEIDRARSHSILIAQKMMKMHSQSFSSDEQINWIANHLHNDYTEHGFPILYPEAKEIGLPVEKAPHELNDQLRTLVNMYDSNTDPVYTHFNENYYHLNGFEAIVESTGLRTTLRVTFDKRFDAVTKIWRVENDLTKWVNLRPQADGKILIQPLDFQSSSTDKDQSDLPTGS